jgi:hypothetical protein
MTKRYNKTTLGTLSRIFVCLDTRVYDFSYVSLLRKVILVSYSVSCDNNGKLQISSHLIDLFLDYAPLIKNIRYSVPGQHLTSPNLKCKRWDLIPHFCERGVYETSTLPLSAYVLLH